MIFCVIPCKSEILPALTPISLVLSATFSTNPSGPFTVSFNARTVPTGTAVSPVPSITSSVIMLPVLIVALVRVAPSDFAYALNALNTVLPVTKPSPSSPEVIVPLFTFSTFPFSVSIVRPSPAFTFNAPSSAIVKPSPAFTFNAFSFASSIVRPSPALTFNLYPFSSVSNVRPSPAFTSKMSLFFAIPFPKPNAVPPVVVNVSNASCN